MRLSFRYCLLITGFLGSFAAPCAAEQSQVQIQHFFASPDGQTYTLNGPGPMAYFSAGRVRFGTSHSIEVEFLGHNPQVQLEPAGETGGSANYLLGPDPNQWRRNVPVYSSLRYKNLWPGIDLVYRLDHQRLKADFLVAAGASPAQIRWRYADGAKPEIDKQGGLQITSESAHLDENAPVLFQGSRQIPGSFQIHDGGEVSFAVGQFDPKQPLLIDPVISFGTYFGGSGTSSATSVTHNAAGLTIVGGWTSSPSSPNTQLGTGGSVDGFVAGYATGGALKFCTYLGGTGDDRILGVAVDGSGNIVLTGSTTSKNFPVRTPFQPSSGGGRDAFITKLDPTGATLLFSSYLGGSDTDQGNGIATDPAGNIYVAGDTRSTNFQSFHALQPSKSGGQDAFVTKVTPTGQLVYSTFLGGGGDERGTSLAVNAGSEVFVAGATFSHDFPVKNAFQSLSGGGEDAFVAKLSADGSALVFGTYFGGNGGSLGSDERANAIALDPWGNAYVAGQSSSGNFPVAPGGFQTVSNGGVDAFVAKFDTNGGLKYSTLLSGSSIDVATSVAVGSAGNAFVAGYTASPDFPVSRAIQPGNRGTYNAFVTSLAPSGQRLNFSTYLGGTGLDQATGLSVDRLGNVLVVGSTSSGDFPTANAFQSWLNGTQNAFVARVAMDWKVGCFADGVWTVDGNRDLGYDGTQTSYKIYSFGQAGDLPISGDWTGTGQPRIGVFRNGQWLLDANGNGQWDGPSGGDMLVNFGQAGDVPVVGDWTGSGVQTLGLFRSGTWILDLSGHLSGKPTGVQDLTFNYGCAACTPVVGDWNNTGKTKVGIVDRSYWWIDLNGDNVWTSGVDGVYGFGLPTDQPIAGNWDGSGFTRPGLARNGAWSLDYNANNQSDSNGDLNFYFGPSSCKGVVIR